MMLPEVYQPSLEKLMTLNAGKSRERIKHWMGLSDQSGHQGNQTADGSLYKEEF